jgi:nucleotide-binding universal stress UspA family protein
VVSEAEAYLAHVRKRLIRQSRVTVETLVWHGPAARAIVEAARIHNAGEIVMTTHGRRDEGL